MRKRLQEATHAATVEARRLHTSAPAALFDLNVDRAKTRMKHYYGLEHFVRKQIVKDHGTFSAALRISAQESISDLRAGRLQYIGKLISGDERSERVKYPAALLFFTLKGVARDSLLEIHAAAEVLARWKPIRTVTPTMAEIAVQPGRSGLVWEPVPVDPEEGALEF